MCQKQRCGASYEGEKLGRASFVKVSSSERWKCWRVVAVYENQKGMRLLSVSFSGFESFTNILSSKLYTRHIRRLENSLDPPAYTNRYFGIFFFDFVHWLSSQTFISTKKLAEETQIFFWLVIDEISDSMIRNSEDCEDFYLSNSTELELWKKKLFMKKIEWENSMENVKKHYFYVKIRWKVNYVLGMWGIRLLM